MDNPETLQTLSTQDTERRQTKQNKNATQKTKKMSTDTTKNWEWTQVSVKGKQFLLLIKPHHFYSYNRWNLMTFSWGIYSLPHLPHKPFFAFYIYRLWLCIMLSSSENRWHMSFKTKFMCVNMLITGRYMLTINVSGYTHLRSPPPMKLTAKI